jgi:hypothetical protein
MFRVVSNGRMEFNDAKINTNSIALSRRTMILSEDLQRV